MSALEERTIGGLHDHLLREVIPVWCPKSATAVDIGAGSGALATRLAELGSDVLAVERDLARFSATVPVVAMDLDDREMPQELVGRRFDLVTAVEVIEHVENPIAFLRLVASFLRTDGTAVITTPNVDNILARAKFLARGEIRMMDAAGDPTHISPIFLDLMIRQYLPRSGLELVARSVYPRDGFRAARPWIA